METNGNKQGAAIRIGCSYRHVNRLVQGYKTKGTTFFLHGNCSKAPAHKTNQHTRKDLASLYANKHAEAHFSHFPGLLRDRERISLSQSTVRSILMERDLLSPIAPGKHART